MKFVKFSQAPQLCQNRVGGLTWHMPCSFFVRFHNFLRLEAPDD